MLIVIKQNFLRHDKNSLSIEKENTNSLRMKGLIPKIEVLPFDHRSKDNDKQQEILFDTPPHYSSKVVIPKEPLINLEPPQNPPDSQ